MIAVLIVLFVIFSALMLQATVIIEYSDEVALTVKLLGIPLHILPEKKKRVKPMTAKQAQKLMKRRAKEESAKRKKAAAKAKKKAEEKRRAAEKKKCETSSREARRKAKEQKKREKEEGATFEENLDLITKLVSFFFSKFFRHLKIKVSRIRIIIGSEEASKTAILYGIALQAVGYILTLLDKVTNLKGSRSTEVLVDVDFLSEEIRTDVKIAFSIRVWHILHLAFGALGRLIKNRVAVRRRVTREQLSRSAPEHPDPPKRQSA